ncbi:MAG: type II toxin-antitoxin system VapC family toxin [Candidatus Methanospirareceae archaeon]
MKKGEKKVILDTNALFIPEEFKVDIFEELEDLGYNIIIVPKKVLDELKELKEKLRGKDRVAANVAHSLIIARQKDALGKCKVVIKGDDGDKDTDRVIEEMALKERAAVLTNDRNLRRRLEKKKITTLYLRGGKRLEERE